jgi:ferredoxin-NADP reductase
MPGMKAAAIFDFWASRVSRTWAWERPLARIVGRQPASANAVTLVLQPNRHFRGVAAGQHVSLGVEIDGRRVTRSYSPSPAPGGRLEITVKDIDGGRVSRHLCREARVGDVLDIGPAFGTLSLPASRDVPLLFLAAGSGITPMLALLRELAARGHAAPATLLYWARTRDELCFADELRAMPAPIAVRFLLTREGDARIDAACLAPLLSDGTHVFACGPHGFVEHARSLTADFRFDGEAFSPPALAGTDTGTVSVTLARSGRTLALPRGQALLPALEAAGLAPAYGCRMGICNTCACGKSAGSTRHLPSGGIEHEPMSALRLCINAATTDLVLDL